MAGPSTSGDGRLALAMVMAEGCKEPPKPMRGGEAGGAPQPRKKKLTRLDFAKAVMEGGGGCDVGTAEAG